MADYGTPREEELREYLRAFYGNNSDYSTTRELLGPAESEQPSPRDVDWSAIENIGGRLGMLMSGMSPAALGGLAAFKGLNRLGGLEEFLQGARNASQYPEEGENWAPRITHEMRFRPKPEDEVIHEVLNRYLRRGERG